jgi:putative NADH-flavin reductase
MNVAVLGATGTIGSRVVAEAVQRGHRVTGVTRSSARIPADPGPVTWQVADPNSLGDTLAGHDVVVNAVNAGSDVAAAIANANVLPELARTLLAAMERQPATRLIVVGGAGSLEVEPGLQVLDVEGFAAGLPQTLGVPTEYVKVVVAHREALNLYRLSNRNWTYLSPSAGLVPPGERTGRFRTGGDQLLVSADGVPAISAEDLAVALVDEIEFPRHLQRRFTVGY